MLKCLSSLGSSKSVYSFICSIIIGFCVNTTFAWSVPPSPAGGNYLALDGEDNYAFLDFKTHGILFGEGANSLTVEGWIYPTSVPDDDTIGTILSQQFVIYTVNWKGDLRLCMRVYVLPWGLVGNAYIGIGSMNISLYQWHHFAFQMGEGRTAYICDDFSYSKTWSGPIEHNLFKESPGFGKRTRGEFVVVGYGGKVAVAWPFRSWGSFAGYIDEVRISKVPRYDIRKKQFTPEGRFEPDVHTIALWHFDEPAGAEIFLDSSPSKHHLIGMNGAVALAVNECSRLAASWGAMKRER